MGTLYKNGIPYGGGGDNSTVITYAEYQNLSEAEKNSDTTYYVSDYPAINSGEIVDNLESNAVDKALSANQGKILNEKMLQIVSFDETTGTLITKSSDYMG